MQSANPFTKTFFLSTLFVIFFAPASVHSCEGHCRTSILTSIQELFNPRLLIAHQTFYQTLFMNLPTDLSQSLVPVVNNIVYTAQQAAIDPAHVTDAKSIRGIFLPQVPYVGINVTGFSGPNCCPSNCTGDCCSDRQWPNVTNVFTKGEMVCGSEYSTATHMDLVFRYVQTILGAQSQFASVDSVGSVALTQQISQQMGSNNSWLVRFLGNLHLGIQNLKTAYSLLKTDFRQTYRPLSTYLICIDHTLDRPQSHPNAYQENCTKPIFSVPIPMNKTGFQFPPANYELVDETPKDTKAISPLHDANQDTWVEDISAELNTVLSSAENYDSVERGPKRYLYAALLSERDGVALEAQAEVGGEVMGSATCLQGSIIAIGFSVVAGLVFVG